MARTALEHALSPDWIDAVFEAERQRQYSCELMFSTVVELMTLVSLGLRPSLHAAARQMDTLPVSLASLYDKVNHTEPGIRQALVQGSAQRLAPVMARMGVQPGLAGYELRVLDGNHLPGSEKRLAVLRGHRGAALPGQSIVVYDPDSGLVTDMIAGEDAHQSERTLAIPLLQGAKAGLDRRPPFLHPHAADGLGHSGWMLHRARAHAPSAPGQPRELARLWPHRHRHGPRTRDCA